MDNGVMGGGRSAPNGIKLSRNGHQPEDDPGQRCKPGGLAGLACLVAPAGAFGLALVAAAGPQGNQVAVEGDLEGQVGGEVVKVLRGKSIRSR
jgi:hypothetical protein